MVLGLWPFSSCCCGHLGSECHSPSVSPMADPWGIAECVKGQGGARMSQSILLHDGIQILSYSCLRQMRIFSGMCGQASWPVRFMAHSLINRKSLWKGDWKSRDGVRQWTRQNNNEDREHRRRKSKCGPRKLSCALRDSLLLASRELFLS